MQLNEQFKEQMNQQLAEQQEEFFQKIQEREDEAEALRRELASLRSSGGAEPQRRASQGDASSDRHTG